MDAKELGRALALGAAKVAGRVALWGALGLLAGGVMFFAELQGGLLLSAEKVQWAVWILTALVLILGSGFVLGALGGLRGLGYFAITVGVDQGIVSAIAGRLLGAVFRKLGLSGEGAVGRRLEKLPLAQWETALKDAMTLDEAEAREKSWPRRTLSKFFASSIERVLLSAFRNEDTTGISMALVEEFAHERLNFFFIRAVETWMWSQTTLFMAGWGALTFVGPLLRQVLSAGAAPERPPVPVWVTVVLFVPATFFLTAVARRRRKSEKFSLGKIGG